MKPTWSAFHRSTHDNVGSVTASPVKRRTSCRLCESKDVEIAFSLAATPPANAFVPPSQQSLAQPSFPLDVVFCRNCAHVQLADVVDPKILFENYVYVSGTSPTFVRHFEGYADALVQQTGLNKDALVVDIGSNDGTLLRAFQQRHGARVLGVDPARAIAEAAIQSGIETWAAFFSPEVADKIVAQYGRASIVTANNVFAHIDDLGGVLNGVSTLLASDGIFSFEVSYLVDVVEKTLFDTIYHEHLSYHSVIALIPFLERHGLELIEAVRVGSHGGSLRAIVQFKGGPKPVGDSVARAVAQERAMGLDTVAPLHRLKSDIDELGRELRALLQKVQTEGKTVAGFGAPAKATTLMYQFGLDARDLRYIIDDSPLKQGLLSPGLHVPVISRQEAASQWPDYLLVLAWNFADAIIANNSDFQKSGGRFIVPVPELKVV